jgi:MATE family multidrug resistance protein
MMFLAYGTSGTKARTVLGTGIARGCGWQHIGAYINLGAYYFVGIPVAVLLCFILHLGGKGLWIGILTGNIVQATLLALITGFTDWEKQVLLIHTTIRVLCKH